MRRSTSAALSIGSAPGPYTSAIFDSYIVRCGPSSSFASRGQMKSASSEPVRWTCSSRNGIGNARKKSLSARATACSSSGSIGAASTRKRPRRSRNSPIACAASASAAICGACAASDSVSASDKPLVSLMSCAKNLVRRETSCIRDHATARTLRELTRQCRTVAMIGFIVVAASVVITGYGVASWLWKRLGAEEEAPRTFERAASGIVAGAALWIAANWILAIAHLLTFTSLMIVTWAFAVAAAATLWRHRAAMNFRWATLALLPIALWIVFILWRGAIVPPLSHDALAYHLPKAVMIMQTHGYETFRVADQRIVTLPANYELLLADVLILSGTDRLTEWLGTIAYLAMLILTGAFAERWWRADRAAIAASILAVAATPLFLLHSGADKNDLMTAFFCGATLLWGARWFARGGRMPLLLAILSLALAVGTKQYGAAIGVGLAPFAVTRLIRDLRSRSMRVRELLAYIGAGVLALALLGGASYVYARVPASPASAAPDAHRVIAPFAYGDWANIWQVPYLILTAPFSPQERGVWAPWSHTYWYWPRYEIYFSNYGYLFSLLAVAAPFVAFAWRRRPDAPAALERRTAAIASAVAIVLMLPVVVRPRGIFAGAFPRYAAFIVPVVICWALPPLLARMRTRPRIAAALLAGLAALFVIDAADCAVNDNFAPLDYVLRMRAHPGSREVYFESNRAASVVDRLAGPRDTIAVDGTFDTWVYPAYGAQLTRRIVYLDANASGDTIPVGVRWVIIDRSWNTRWTNKAFTDLGKKYEYYGTGSPRAEDLRLFDRLRADPRFRLVFRDRANNQAVFERL